MEKVLTKNKARNISDFVIRKNHFSNEKNQKERWHSDTKESILEIKNHYDVLADIFDTLPIAAKEGVNIMVKSIPMNSREYALDIGSGTGRTVSQLSDKFNFVTGIELSNEMVDYATEICKNKKNTAFIQMDVRNIDLQENSYDYIVSHTTLHHLVDDLEPTLKKIKKLLKPNGKILIIDMLAIGLMKYDPSLVRRISASIIFYKEFFTKGFTKANDNYKIATHPAWMAHLKKDKYYSREYFKKVYGSVFPNAKFTEYKKEYGMNHLIMMEWTKD